LISEGTPRELRTRLAGRVLELTGEPQALMYDVARKDEDVENVQRFGTRYHLRVRDGKAETVVERLTGKIKEAGGTLESLRAIESQLEDVFISLSEGQV
jgi:ABC-2 type transport system ATP-binding protein